MDSKAALYVRVSTMHQIDKDSLPFQRNELVNYAKYALNIEDIEIFEDAGYSAKNTDRPKYQQMMKRIRNGEFTHLLVWKIDRISRNLKDFTEMYEELQKYKITFISKNEQFDTSSAMGEAMLKIILVFAELERKLTAERVFSIMLSRAQKGLWNGATVPLGYVWSEADKFPVIAEQEAQVVQYIYDLYEKFATTIKVAVLLNEKDIPTKRGGKWTAKTVRDILRNPFYIGTYRYNLREQGSRRLKNKDEWIVIEDNHPGIISKEQHYRVNDMLSKNYKGVGTAQRANVHTHIFAKLLYCQKCGAMLTSGLDAARKDGYRPSRYTCSTNQRVDNIKSCGTFLSDIVIAPFVINYISNLLRFQERITPKHTIKDMERALLRGSAFIDVIGIDDKSLKESYTMLSSGFVNKDFSIPEDTEIIDLSLERLIKEKKKYVKALSRLEDLYLFDTNGISKKDYITKKNEIQEHLESVEVKINQSKQQNKVSNEMFVDKAKYFLITQEMQQSRDINFRVLINTIGNEILADFIQATISKIIVADKQVQSITFKNGITHTFVYKPVQERKVPVNSRGRYKQHYGTVLQYIKEHGSISRPEVEKLANIKRSSASSLLQDLMTKGLIVRRGYSTAIRYFLNNDV